MTALAAGWLIVSMDLLLNSITDEWFACIAFLLLWGFLLVRMLAQIIGAAAD